MRCCNARLAAVSLGLLAQLAGHGCSGERCRAIDPEARTICLRDPSELPKARIPETPAPPTVSDSQDDLPVREISLDDAIRIALENSEVVRILTGVSASSSGRTIYETAIANTVIDQEQSRFDPQLKLNNAFDRVEDPHAEIGPVSPIIDGTRVDNYDFDLELSKTTHTGGEATLSVSDNLSRFKPGVFPLNPQNSSAVTLGYIQPLMRGAGQAANMAPIVIARIETERSFFQLKDSVQELVRGVIDAYWLVVAARTNVWSRRQQVDQGKAAFERAEARQRRGFSSAGEVAQARLALANFEASLIGAEAAVLEREAALRNIMGLPPSDSQRLVPVTPPSVDRLKVNWNEIIQLAEERRPDLIELKLIIEADEQFLVQARNQAQPQLDAVALYRWNGLEGETPAGSHLSTNGGEFTDWTLGVNFSVPLGLRQARATLRRRELIIERDRANLDQGLHSAQHDLAANVRRLAQFYEQYAAYRRAREAARANLDQQMADFNAGRAIFLDVLQAITSWSDSVSLEAGALTQYNTELANLERVTGSILETHGIHFYEERFASIGPCGRLGRTRCYPESTPPTPNTNVYVTSPEPAENSFNLESPVRRRSQ
jgi:outer membrane protein TolC